MKLTGVEHRLTQLEVKVSERAGAVRLQRGETDRRLKELNNENKRIREFQAKVPSTDSFEALNERVKLLESRQSEYAGRRETQTEAKGQTNFNLSQWITVAGIAALVLIDLHRSGII